MKCAVDLMKRAKNETNKSSFKPPKLKQKFDIVAMVKKEEKEKTIRAQQALKKVKTPII